MGLRWDPNNFPSNPIKKIDLDSFFSSLKLALCLSWRGVSGVPVLTYCCLFFFFFLSCLSHLRGGTTSLRIRLASRSAYLFSAPPCLALASLFVHFSGYLFFLRTCSFFPDLFFLFFPFLSFAFHFLLFPSIWVAGVRMSYLSCPVRWHVM